MRSRPDLAPGKGVEHVLRQGVTGFWEKLVEDNVGLQIMQYELLAYAVRNGDHRPAHQQYDSHTSVVADFCEQAARAAGERCAVGFDTLGRLALAQVDGLILQYIARPDAHRARRVCSAPWTLRSSRMPTRSRWRPHPTRRKPKKYR